MAAVEQVKDVITYSLISARVSNVFYCYGYKGKITDDWTEDPMTFVLMKEMESSNDPLFGVDVELKLLNVLSMDQIVLEVTAHCNRERILIRLKEEYEKKFEYVLFKSLVGNANIIKSNMMSIHNAENYSNPNEEKQSMENDDFNTYKTRKDSNSENADADVEDSVSMHSEKQKMSPAKVKMERMRRMKNKNCSTVSKPIPNGSDSSQASSKRRPSAHKKLKSSLSNPKESQLAAPPISSSSESEQKEIIASTQECIVQSKPKPSFDSIPDQKTDNMPRPVLPRFDFPDTDPDSEYGAKPNDPTPVYAEYKNTLHHSKIPKWTNPNQNKSSIIKKNGRNLPKFHAQNNQNNMGQPYRKPLHYKRKNTSNAHSHSSSYQHHHQAQNHQKKHVQIQPQPYKKELFKVRTGPPVLSGLFGHSQSEQEYKKFHQEARAKYCEKVKSEPKSEKNVKNFFLLPILRKFGHQIGTKIGERDYGFQSESGLDGKKLFLRTKGNEYRGVDYPIKEKEEKEKKVQNQNPVSQIMEVMQSHKQFPKQDFFWNVTHNYQYGGFECTFVIIENFQKRVVCTGQRVATKKDAKAKCAERVRDKFLNDPYWAPKYAATLNRKMKGIKGSENQNGPPKGFEYPIHIFHGRRGAKYEFIQSKRQIRCKEMNDYNPNCKDFHVIIYKDRGMFGNNNVDNPSVEREYERQWEKFKGIHDIPTHCHKYLDERGHFIKQFDDNSEQKEIWKSIWKEYKTRPNFHHRQQRGYVQQKEQKVDNYYNNADSLQLDEYVNDENKSNNIDYGRNDNYMQQHQSQNGFRHHKRMNNPRANACEYMIVYDFDGTIYTQRLSKYLTKSGVINSQQKTQYFANLSSEEIIEKFGGKERVQCLDIHFSTLKTRFGNKLCIGLLAPYYSSDNLNLLFKSIGVRDVSAWFDEVYCGDSEISDNVRKQKAIERLCNRKGVKISTENVLYIDDDRKTHKSVNCCSLFESSRLFKHRNGIDPKQMGQIVHVMEGMIRPNRKNHASKVSIQSNASCVQFEVCTMCGNTCRLKEMHTIDGAFHMCPDCWNDNQRAMNLNNSPYVNNSY